jgi:hypothetical protein
MTANPQTFTATAAPLQRLTLAERWYIDKRLAGLARFATAITLLNILGHLWLGFEQSWVTPFVALAAAYATELTGETVQAWADGRRPRYLAGPGATVSLLLSAHISAMACAMLLFAAEQLWCIAFAASLAVASKYVIRVPVIGSDGKTSLRHVLNPSNLGITATLLLWPSVGIAPPYQFAENIDGARDWILPGIIVLSGTFLNGKLTGRLPLIGAWLAAFAAQAALRSGFGDAPHAATLMPMTGFAFVLFTFYMITDPATSPARWPNQVVFAVAVAAIYAAIMQAHIVFGLFYALTIATAARGLWLWLDYRLAAQRRAGVAPGMVGRPAE